MARVFYLKYFEWVTSGLAGAALALFIFAPSMEAANPFYRELSIHFFVASMPLFVLSSAASRVFVKVEPLPEKTLRNHNLLLTLGILSFLGGMGLLCMAKSLSLLISFLAPLIITLIMYVKRTEIPEKA